MANVTQRIRVYGLRDPECMKVADAENLPFETGSFDLGYSWGVLHHTQYREVGPGVGEGCADRRRNQDHALQPPFALCV